MSKPVIEAIDNAIFDVKKLRYDLNILLDRQIEKMIICHQCLLEEIAAENVAAVTIDLSRGTNT